MSDSTHIKINNNETINKLDLEGTTAFLVTLVIAQGLQVNDQLILYIQNPTETVSITTRLTSEQIAQGFVTLALANDNFLDSTANYVDGDYSFSLSANSQLKGVIEYPGQASLTLDTSAPSVALRSFYTNSSSPEVSGTVDDADAQVTVIIDDVEYAALNNGDGTWTLAAGIIAQLAGAVTRVEVIATDAAGNQDSASTRIIADTQGPSFESQSLSYSQEQQVGDVVGSMTATDNYGVANYLFLHADGSENRRSEEGFFFIDKRGEITLLAGAVSDFGQADLQHLYNIVSYDHAGNRAVAQVTLVEEGMADTTGAESYAVPSVSLTYDSGTDNHDLITSDGKLSVVASIVSSSIEYSADSGATWHDSQPTPVSGVNSVYVRETNLAGESSEAVIIEFTLDTQGPSVSLRSFFTNTGSPLFTGTIDDAQALVTVVISNKEYQGVNNGDGTWTLASGEIDDLTDTVSYVNVFATDSAGNQGTTSTRVILDTQGPVFADQSIEYSENQHSGNVVATITASDNYVIANYLFVHADGSESRRSEDGLFLINKAGEITILAPGVTGDANDFERGDALHLYDVVSYDHAGNKKSAAISLVESDDTSDNTAQQSKTSVIHSAADNPSFWVNNNDQYVNLAEVGDASALLSNIEIEIELGKDVIAGEIIYVVIDNPLEVFAIKRVLKFDDIKAGFIKTQIANNDIQNGSGEYLDGNYDIEVHLVTVGGASDKYQGSQSFILSTEIPASPASINILDGADGHLSAAEIAADINVEIAIPDNAKVGSVLYLDINSDGVNEQSRAIKAEDIGATMTFVVPGSLFVASGEQVNVRAHIVDLAGNVSPSIADTSTVDVSAITLDENITADDLIIGTDAHREIAITGTVTGTFDSGDVVTLLVNQLQFTGVLDNTGRFSINVLGQHLIDDANSSIEATVENTKADGTTSPKWIISDSETYDVDTSLIDTDGDDIHDGVDIDDDNDGILDINESMGVIDSSEQMFRAGTSESYSLALDDYQVEGAQQSLKFSEDGDKLFMTGFKYGWSYVLEYDLATAYDANSKQLTTAYRLPVGWQTTPSSIEFSEGGSMMFVLCSETSQVFVWDLSDNNYDLSNANFEREGTYSFAEKDSDLAGISFSGDGHKMFLLSSENHLVYEYNLSTAYSLETAIYAGKLSVVTQEKPTSLAFSAEGDQLYVLGSSSNSLSVYALESQYSVTSGVNYIGDVELPSGDMPLMGFTLSTDGSTVYTLDSENSEIQAIDLIDVAADDSDGDNVINALDLDSDNDGIADNIEGQTTAGYIPPGVFTDVDQDGLNDIYDQDTNSAATNTSIGITPQDTDGDGIADFLDADSDGDHQSDQKESGLGEQGSQATYDDPNGVVDNPAQQLKNSNTSGDVDYRENAQGVEFLDYEKGEASYLYFWSPTPTDAYTWGLFGGTRTFALPEFTMLDAQDEIYSVTLSSIDTGYAIYTQRPKTTGIGVVTSENKLFTATNSEDAVAITSFYQNPDIDKQEIGLNIPHTFWTRPALAHTNVAQTETVQFTLTVQTIDSVTGVISAPQSFDFDVDIKQENRWVTPLILDLDNDGVETIAQASAGVEFDLDGDGELESVGWAGSDDGFLVRDLNSDGIINDGSELFGEGTVLSDGETASDGFSALSELDSNADSVIDKNDAAYSELQIWQDANSDGVSQESELISLIDAGVESIDLAAVSVDQINNGNWTGLSSTWTDATGDKHAIDDVWLQASDIDKLDVSDLLSEDVLVDDLDQYLHFEKDADDLLVYIDEDGGFTEESFDITAADKLIRLENITSYSMEYEDVMKVLIDNNQLVVE